MSFHLSRDLSRPLIDQTHERDYIIALWEGYPLLWYPKLKIDTQQLCCYLCLFRYKILQQLTSIPTLDLYYEILKPCLVLELFNKTMVWWLVFVFRVGCYDVKMRWDQFWICLLKRDEVMGALFFKLGERNSRRGRSILNVRLGFGYNV